MAKLTIEEVKHIAKLANLDIGEEELHQFSDQLTDILEFVKEFSKVETKDVAPLANVTGKKNIFRDDKIQPSLPQQEVLRNAPSTHKGYFKNKLVLEK